MRSFLAWIVTVGMIVGMMSRAVHAEDLHDCASHPHPQMEAPCFDFHPADSCQCGLAHCDENGSSSDCKSSGHHHHHHICCVSSPLITDPDASISFAGVTGVRLNLTFDRGVAPEEPVFELDTPPLI